MKGSSDLLESLIDSINNNRLASDNTSYVLNYCNIIFIGDPSS